MTVAGSVDVRVRAETSQLGSGLNRAKTQAQQFTATMNSRLASVTRSFATLNAGAARTLGFLRGPAGLAGIALTAAGGLAAVAQRALETTRRHTELGNAILVTGNRSRTTLQEIENLSYELSRSTGRSVDDIRAVNLELVKLGVVGVNTFREIVSSASRLSAAGFGTLEENARRLAGAINDPRQALLALHQEGVTFTEQQARLVRQLAATNRHFDAQRVILDNVRDKTKDVRDESFSFGRELLGAAEDVGRAILNAIVDLDWLDRKLNSVGRGIRNWRDQISGRADDARVRNLGLDQVRTNVEAIEKALNDLRTSGTIDAMNKAFLQLAVPKMNVDNLLPMQALHVLLPELERYRRIQKELEDAEAQRAQRSGGRASNDAMQRALGLAPDHLQKLRDRLQLERETLGMTDAQARAHETIARLREQQVAVGPKLAESLRNEIIELENLKSVLRTIDEAASSVFTGMTDALTDFAVTGAFDVKKMADSIIRDLLRIAMQAYVVRPLLNMTNSFAAGMFGGGSFGTSWAPRVTPAGFADGGAFKVPGSGGGDRPTLMGLSPGELVTVTPQHRVNDQAPQVINNVIVNSSREFETEQRQRTGADGKVIIETIVTEVQKSMGRGDFDPIMESRWGNRTRTSRR